MNDNNESAEDSDASPHSPIWLIIIKWSLVVVNCMWIFADSIAIIMGKSVTNKVKELPDSDSTIRFQASVELTISLIGLFGLIGEKFYVLVFHCTANTLYYITIFIIDQSEMFVFASLWVLATVFYAYQIKFGRYRID